MSTESYDGIPVGEFAYPGPLRDKLVSAILSGQKTATSSLKATYDSAGEPIPIPGRREIVIDSANQPVCVIEYTKVECLKIADISDEFIQAEGEGFTGKKQWLQAHKDFWESSQYAAEYANQTAIDDDTLIVCEFFKLIHIFTNGNIP